MDMYPTSARVYSIPDVGLCFSLQPVPLSESGGLFVKNE